MDKQKKNMGAVAFLPLIVFLVCYVGCGITFTLLGADANRWESCRVTSRFLVGVGVVLCFTVALVYRIS